ncbi:glucosaminidase domain-containing protein [Enterococcus sp. DIV0756]|uniref:glucosaminidase domain-containing protein n=1 Tax=Enterococcus sp. DIV0756 TaxID=2774636 RepID=UPI003F2574DD
MKSRKTVLALSTLLFLSILSILALPFRQSLLAKTEETAPTHQPSSAEVASPLPSSEPAVSESSSIKEESSRAPEKESSTIPSTEATSSTDDRVPVSSIKETEETKEKTVASSAGTEKTASEKKATSAAQATVAPTSVIQPPATKQEVEANYNFSVVKNQTTQEFIDSIGADAQAIAWKEDLYASVMIAQAILETGSGNSQLARPPYHNLFGIKGSYQGKQVNFATQEDNGSGQLYTIQSGFRQYPSYKESLEDYAALLKNGISGNTNFYQGVWKEIAKTYQEATKALTGKYATDTQYDKKLNALIETYQLTDYDSDPAKREKSEKADKAEKATTKKEKEPNAKDKTEETQAAVTEKNTALTEESLQQVSELLPIPQRPAKQVPGYLKTQ